LIKQPAFEGPGRLAYSTALRGRAAMKGMHTGPGKEALVLAIVGILSFGVHYQTIAQESEQYTIGILAPPS